MAEQIGFGQDILAQTQALNTSQPKGIPLPLPAARY